MRHFFLGGQIERYNPRQEELCAVHRNHPVELKTKPSCRMEKQTILGIGWKIKPSYRMVLKKTTWKPPYRMELKKTTWKPSYRMELKKTTWKPSYRMELKKTTWKPSYRMELKKTTWKPPYRMELKKTTWKPPYGMENQTVLQDGFHVDAHGICVFIIIWMNCNQKYFCLVPRQ